MTMLPPKVIIQEQLIYGWQGYCLRVGDVALGVTPQIGGRIISLRYKGTELLFSQDEHKGEVFDFSTIHDLQAEKIRLGFRLWGGDKTWVAPQYAWMGGVPPLDLDAGQYVVDVDETGITMTSPLCRETGIRIIRRVTLNTDGSIFLDQTFRNESENIIKKGIWDVTQIVRPFDVYLPAQENQIRAYKDEGSVEEAQHKISSENNWVKIRCDEPLHFKFGGFIREGRLVLLRKGGDANFAFTKTFTINVDAHYAHDAIVEVYNSPQYDYLEIEVHAPLVPLKKGEEISHRQIWHLHAFMEKEINQNIFAYPDMKATENLLVAM
jgi:hypothetical protein